jgi:hypothetical protein
MRVLPSLVLALVMMLPAAGASGAGRHRLSVLFVGNSLTYVANTPAVLDALASVNHATISSDMLVRGGATLTQRVHDGSIASALAVKRYDAVVLQERGGDLMCSFGPGSCTDSRTAIKAIVSLARTSGAKVYLLGTYQGNARASTALVAAESGAAAEVGIPYVEVSEKLQVLRAEAPSMAWQAADGAHPGADLALLNAVSLYGALLGRLPEPAAFSVHAPIYGTTSGLTEALRSAEAPPPLATTPRSIQYSAAAVRTVLKSLGRRGGS